ncbi:MAG TPA: prephenate dehydrogenase/arogenate dehydrogenase family protein [Candidatus Bathyarchaeia archaeon]|nr:prephenate dehydrogenase/arogenate dehydrogenase family protein [Candidatus Bathyarchaeia archaeon]
MVIANVIGGAGRMGNWFARFLKANGYTVILTDKDGQTAKTLSKRYGFQFVSNQLEAASKAQVIILATPTKVTSAVLQQIAPAIKPTTLIVEISSIKRPIVGTIRKLQKKGIAILSIHPMFGSGTTTIKGRRILVVTRPQNYEARRILSIFRMNGAGIIRCTLKKHDALASTILTLPHFINISLIETLRSLGVKLNEISLVAGSTFQLQLLLAEAIYNEDYDNEVSILGDCKTTAIEEYKRQAEAVFKMVNMPRSLERLLRSGRRFVEAHEQFATSYRRFNAAVQASLP